MDRQNYIGRLVVVIAHASVSISNTAMPIPQQTAFYC